MSRNRAVVPQPTPRISCDLARRAASESRQILNPQRARRCGAISGSVGVSGSGLAIRSHNGVSFLLCLDEGQQRTIGRRGRDANGASTADTGTADRLLHGGKIGCRQHEARTAALG